jgi:hypothetical protein
MPFIQERETKDIGQRCGIQCIEKCMNKIRNESNNYVSIMRQDPSYVYIVINIHIPLQQQIPWSSENLPAP